MPGAQNSSDTLNWLAGVGSEDKGDKVQLNHVATALVQLADILIVEATHNLQKKGNVATGDTAKSMQVVNVQTNATKVSLDIEILSTYKFLNEGVNGVEKARGSKFSFKTKFANKKMALAILKWIKRRRVVSKYAPHSAYSDKLKGKDYGATEKKNKRIKAASDAASSQKSLAYAMSVGIKKSGIERTLFFSKAVAETRRQQKKLFADAFKLDIIETLQKLN